MSDIRYHTTHRISDDGTVFRDRVSEVFDGDKSLGKLPVDTLTITPDDKDERFADESARTKRIIATARDPEALKVWAAKQAQA